MERLSPEQVAAVRRRVQLAFGELRKVGFISKTNFSCCMNCAVSELGDIAEKRRRNRAVYWHLQDETHFRKGGSLYIRFCYLPPKGIEGDTTRAVTEIGEQAVAALRKAGLELDWNGNPNVTIRITGITSQFVPERNGQHDGTA